MIFLLQRSLLLFTVTIGLTMGAPLFADTLAQLETAQGGRLGVAAINTANDTLVQYQADERFPFCSTFKFMVVSAILKASMTDPQLLQQKVTYTKADLKGYSPITEQHLAGGMTISELCGAAIDYSDNTAANLLMKQLGGVQAVNAFARSIGDKTFQLDRWEPKLNTAIPGDLRDTTSPAAMAKDLQQVVLGNVLASSQREQLQAWLKANTTGNARIRAGVPQGWIVADKTGTGDYGTTNDIGVIWPPHSPPIVLVVYYTQDQQNALPREDVIASATRIVINELSPK